MKGRIVEPEEIAGVVYLMTLDEASAVNGTTVMADDGYSAFKGIDGDSVYNLNNGSGRFDGSALF